MTVAEAGTKAPVAAVGATATAAADAPATSSVFMRVNFANMPVVYHVHMCINIALKNGPNRRPPQAESGYNTTEGIPL